LVPYGSVDFHQLLDTSHSFLCLVLVSGGLGEQCEGGLQSTGRGPKSVNVFGVWVSEVGLDSSSQRFREFVVLLRKRVACNQGKAGFEK
jgi:hypothetical protein